MLIHGWIMKHFMSYFNNVSCKHLTKKLPYFYTIYIWIIVLCTLSLHIFKKCSQSQKSLEEYFSSPSKCTYSIYIHSWVHIKHPFRKVSFLIVAMEGMPGRDNTLSPYSVSFMCCAPKGFVNHCRFQQIKHIQKQTKSILKWYIPFRPYNT